MLRRKIPSDSPVSIRPVVASVVLISNALIWYASAFSVLKNLIGETSLVLWSAHFASAVFSALAGSKLSGNRAGRTLFIGIWMILGVLSSLLLMFVSAADMIGVAIISILLGVSFGLGLPASLALFADSTSVENRAGLGGLVLLLDGLGSFSIGMFMGDNIVVQALILAAWRIIGLVLFLVINPLEQMSGERISMSFSAILSQRTFILYLVPWTMFSLVNYLSLPVQFKIIQDPGLVSLLMTIENVLLGVFAVVGGLLSDIVGRKRVTIFGFVLLGLGYGALGIYPRALMSWYFYTFVDGVAWGIFSVMFIITIWGDVSYGSPSDKHFAIGGIPFFISNFLRLVVGSQIAEVVSENAIFSLTALFLFLAVLPLMAAPETLPERKIKERELRKYIEKAKRIKQQHS